ncbi:MAG: magnesium transporter [Candidatus Odinarchaeota archaeon]|nr:magnesium transporter [Candidatus Odinarchaeota archaeon]
MTVKSKSFLGVFLEAFSSLLFDILGLIAGFITSLVAVFVIKMPWILIVYPALLTVRGNISGIFSGRLTTGLHVGLIRPSIRKNTDYFYSLQASIFFMSFVNALVIALLSYTVYIMLEPTQIISFQIILYVVLLSMLIPTTVSIFFLAPLIGKFAYRKGADPDTIVYPILSTINDIIVSATYVLIIMILIFSEEFFILLSYISLFIFVFILIISSKYSKSKNFQQTIFEGMPTVVILAIISNFTGGILSQFRCQIEKFPYILVVYPSLIDTVGDEGSIIASVFSTKLNIGYATPSFKEIVKRENRIIIIGTFSAGTVVFMIFTIIGCFIYTIAIFEILKAIMVVILTNGLLLLPVTLIAFASAILTFKHGLNPDNFTIPLIASLSDFLTTTILFLVITILQL